MDSTTKRILILIVGMPLGWVGIAALICLINHPHVFVFIVLAGVPLLMIKVAWRIIALLKQREPNWFTFSLKELCAVPFAIAPAMWACANFYKGERLFYISLIGEYVVMGLLLCWLKARIEEEIDPMFGLIFGGWVSTVVCSVLAFGVSSVLLR